MSKKRADVIARIRSLRILVPETWDGGPYTADQIRDAEKLLNLSLDSIHQLVLEQVGGNFTFETGAVHITGDDRDVQMFLGLGPPYDIMGERQCYSDQIPLSWYPFAKDMDGYLYALAQDGTVHHIPLEEEVRTADSRLEIAGERIADSFAEFVMSLRLPDWAIAYYGEQDR